MVLNLEHLEKASFIYLLQHLFLIQKDPIKYYLSYSTYPPVWAMSNWNISELYNSYVTATVNGGTWIDKDKGLRIMADQSTRPLLDFQTTGRGWCFLQCHLVWDLRTERQSDRKTLWWMVISFLHYFPRDSIIWHRS